MAYRLFCDSRLRRRRVTPSRTLPICFSEMRPLRSRRSISPFRIGLISIASVHSGVWPCMTPLLHGVRRMRQSAILAVAAELRLLFARQDNFSVCAHPINDVDRMAVLGEVDANRLDRLPLCHFPSYEIDKVPRSLDCDLKTNFL